eukprot:CAMPEP_0173143058 /NCGR_PEP_ID=MMETSP1105-20130129/6453_1 /TAXON_ID=2985 /ORGANISM="Ochromonas sp., Strain BG-1" /LENGTH=504 /DNA_ID=CAMNT_0014056559 /DNA_START=22 /DNA_END=1536 /DNA_ORIENTATION=+
MANEVKEEIPAAMWKAAILIALQGFLYGYFFTGDSGSGSDCYNNVESCPKGTVYNDINLTNDEVQVASALVVAGGWIGCMVGSIPTESKGRKWTILWNNVFFIVGAVLTAIGNLPCLLIGRFIAGIGVGIATVAPPVLLSELASPANRGIITTAFQGLLTGGIFIASILSYGFVENVSHGWQYIQAFAAIPAIITVIFQSGFPESPKWLLARDSSESTRREVAKILTALRPPGYNVEEEIQNMVNEAKNDAQSDASWSEVFACRKAMVIGCGLMFFQAATGINSVVFYSSTIFQLAGFDQSIIGTVCWTALNCIMTFVSAKLIDQAGRKTLILSGTTGMMVSLLVLSIVLLSPIDGTVQGYIAVVAVLLFVAGFATGLGAVCWTIISEIMPTRLRSKAVSLFLSINWAMNLVIGLVTLTAINGIGGASDDMDDDSEKEDRQKVGVGALYLIFGGISAACVAFIVLFVPETKGKTPEDLLHATTPLLGRENDEDHHDRPAKHYDI